MSEPESSSKSPSEVDAVALEHARAMLLAAAGLRTRNYQFFILIVAAFVASLGANSTTVARSFAGGALSVLALAALIVDARTMKLIRDARAPLYDLERKFGLSIHEFDQVEDRTRGILSLGRNRFLTHTTAYRMVYALACLVGAWSAVTGGQR